MVVCPLISHSAVICRNFGLGLFGDLKFGEIGGWLEKTEQRTHLIRPRVWRYPTS